MVDVELASTYTTTCEVEGQIGMLLTDSLTSLRRLRARRILWPGGT